MNDDDTLSVVWTKYKQLFVFDDREYSKEEINNLAKSYLEKTKDELMSNYYVIVSLDVIKHAFKSQTRKMKDFT